MLLNTSLPRRWTSTLHPTVISTQVYINLSNHGCWVQWAKSGDPTKFEDVIPRKWLASGFQRKLKLSPLAFLDLCRNHSIQTEDELWALAWDLEAKGDKALMAYAMENDVEAALVKVGKAMGARETLARANMTRMDILKAYAAERQCTCPTRGLCYDLIKDCLRKNKIDGEFQRLVVGALQVGRKKERNICVIGSANMAKSYLLKPLCAIYRTYTRPDGGSYQLERLLGKELVFLNDFEYDDDAKKWMNWGYLKNFLEGMKVDVALPKNKGSNTEFKSDAPVFMTAPQEVSLYRGKQLDTHETRQMAARIKYVRLSHVYDGSDRKEAESCGHCGARV